MDVVIQEVCIPWLLTVRAIILLGVAPSRHGRAADPGKLVVGDGDVAGVTRYKDAIAVQPLQQVTVDCDRLGALNKYGTAPEKAPIPATGYTPRNHGDVSGVSKFEALHRDVLDGLGHGTVDTDQSLHSRTHRH